MAQPKFVPPFSDFDGPSPELVILLFEAMARVTDAFRELRDTILPRYDPPNVPVNDIESWVSRWHLGDFENTDLGNYARSFPFMVLDYWRRNTEARDALRVDCEWWDRRPKQLEFVTASLSTWDLMREDFDVYAKRMRDKFEKYLQEQRRSGEGELERFGMRQFRQRERNRPAAWDFEWVALSLCCGLSDGQIALRKEYRGVTRESVKKARQKLKKDLKILRVGK